jgi:hypothetical protein
MTRKLVGLVAVLAAAFVIAPASASAGLLVASADDCAAQSLSQVFMPWADPSNYTLNPGGDFESRQDWSLDGASIVPGNEPFYVGSARDSRSLSLPSGSSAVSDSICVGIEHPTLRFFVRSSNPRAALRVDVLFEDGFGNQQSATIGAVTGAGAWAPSALYPVVVNLLPLLPGERTAVAFKFSAAGGTFQIDDVYVDPYKSR